MRKKIGLFLGVDQDIGGAYHYNLALLTAVAGLPGEQYEIVICCGNEAYAAELKDLPLSVLKLRRGLWTRVLCKAARTGALTMAWWRRIFPWFNPVARELLEQKCDLWIFPAGDEWAYEAPLPALVAIHDLMHRYERGFPEVSGRGEYQRRERQNSRICRWARGVLVDSKVGKGHVQESYGINPEHIKVLPFIPPSYIYQPERVGGVVDHYRLPNKFILYPANFFAHKNHQGLIEAVARLADRLADLQLVFAGAPFPAERYEVVSRLVKERKLQDQVHFLGYVPNQHIAELYRRARALVMPSFFGPTNIPPLEAITLGCPVAVAEIYGAREQLEDAALYFDPKSVEDMARTLERLWCDDGLCQDLSRRGLRRAGEWNQAQFSARLRAIIDEVLR